MLDIRKEKHCYFAPPSSWRTGTPPPCPRPPQPATDWGLAKDLQQLAVPTEINADAAKQVINN